MAVCAGQTGVAQGDDQWEVGVCVVVVVCEGEQPARLQRPGRVPVHVRHPVREVEKIPALRLVARQFAGGPGRLVREERDVAGHHAAQPDIAEVHEFGVLQVVEVGRIRDNGVD